jgi:tetratricopeptide (TPR) repeat protein
MRSPLRARLFRAALFTSLALTAPLRAAPGDAKNDGKTAEQRAADLQAMKEHFKSGLTHYSLGEFAEAASEFREAYRLHNEPAILFNIAQAMRQMNDYRHAYFYYSQFLSQRPDAANRTEVEQFMLSMKSKMDQEEPLNVSPAAPADSANSASLDGEVAVAGKPTDQRAVASAPGAAVAIVPAPPLSSEKQTFFTGPHIGGIAAAGGALALGLVAVISHASAQSDANTLNQKYQDGTLTTQDASLKSDVDSKGKLATIGAIGGAVLLAAGAVLIFAF